MMIMAITIMIQSNSPRTTPEVVDVGCICAVGGNSYADRAASNGYRCSHRACSYTYVRNIIASEIRNKSIFSVGGYSHTQKVSGNGYRR